MSYMIKCDTWQMIYEIFLLPQMRDLSPGLRMCNTPFGPHQHQHILSFGYLGPHPKFQNTRTTPSGRKITRGEEEK